MSAVIKEQLPPRLLRRIIERMDPEQIWMFGSRARGDAHKDSDWDLLVILPDSVPEEALDLTKAWKDVRDLHIPADIFPIRRCDFDSDRDFLGTLSEIATHEGRMIHGPQSSH